MKAKKLIRYRVAVSQTFPATHPRKGEPTHFVDKIFRNDLEFTKIHTIRGNYELWENRFEKINKGEAVLELYNWSGKPYNSKCETICQLGKDDGIGVQKLLFEEGQLIKPIANEDHWYKGLALSELAKNDGLSLKDFKAWFKGADLSKPMAIIHFTHFRY